MAAEGGGIGAPVGQGTLPTSASAPTIFPSVSQTPLLAVQIVNQADGVTTDITNIVLGVRITYGFDIAVSSATIDLVQRPAVGSQSVDFSKYSLVRIYCSGGSTVGNPYPIGTPNVNGIPLRFTGLYLRTESSLWPHTFSLVCAGMLYLAEQLQIPPLLIPGTNTVIPPSTIAAQLNGIPPGVLLFLDVGSQNPVVNSLLPGPSTDQAAIRAILALVTQVATAAGVPGGAAFYNGAGIGGTGITFGSVVPFEFMWSPYRSAMDMINQFDQVCLGFRTHDKYSGNIGRTQIFGYPGVTAIANYTEGLDIWEGSSAARSVQQLCNAAFVEGATVPGSANAPGGTLIQQANAFIQQSNPFQPNTNNPNSPSVIVIDQFSHPWIESSLLLGTPGLTADAVAAWRLTERNRELVTGQWVTYRDDLIFPGQIINVNAPHTAVQENVWLQRVEVRLTAEPVSFTQTMYGLGGGIFDEGSPVFPPVSPY